MRQLLDMARNAYWRARGLPKSPLVLLGHAGRVKSVAFLSGGKEVISGSEDCSARRWRVEDGCEVGRPIREKGCVLAVAASSDGDWMATGGQEKSITIWNAATRNKVVVLEGHRGTVLSLAFSPDSARVVSGSEDKTVIVWRATTARGERLLGRLRGHTGAVRCVCFSPNGDKIVSCDGVDIRIWNSQSGDQVVLRRIASPFAHTNWVCSIAVSTNGKFMASASRDKTIRLWDTSTFTQIGPTLQCDVEVWSVAISPAGSHLVSGGDHGRNITLWNATTCEKAIELEGHSNDVRSLEFSPDSARVVSGSTDKTVIIWSTTTTTTTTTGKSHPDIITSITLSPNGKFMASTSHDRTVPKNITIWDATTYEKVIELEGHLAGNFTRSLEFSRDSTRLVSGSTDKTVIVWNTVTGRQLSDPLKGHTNSVWEAHFSPNGDKIASCDGCDIRIWDSHSGNLVIQPITVKALSLAWTPNGQQLIAGCTEGSIKHFYSPTGFLLADWQVHASLVHSISVSPNGKFVASASPDKTVRLWAMTASKQIGSPLQCPDRVYSVAISPDGTRLARGGRDGKVRIWRLEGMVSPSLLDGTPSTSDVGAHLHELPSNRSFVDVSSSPGWPNNLI
ncbi:hypothetical protein PAXINDRAFT_119273 [Paxillus involutus ATCC 200175]|uniref:WD40 repeat-like protein n=1 Tax=Paxillus involutus ATCC 200175 TaxID=664439 RepID=A0A0C9SRY2_PAXIN|nr:hypothetical protein PAXINDRAFT_119273 [Paxillus involutus ATCC 200175]